MTAPLCDVIPANGPPAPAGAIVSVAVPGKWVLYIAPEHPAYTDLLAAELRRWPTKALRDGFALDGCPHLMREYVKAELARRGKQT